MTELSNAERKALYEKVKQDQRNETQQSIDDLMQKAAELLGASKRAELEAKIENAKRQAAEEAEREFYKNNPDPERVKQAWRSLLDYVNQEVERHMAE